MPARFVPNRALASELAKQFGGLIEQGGFVAEREAKRRSPVETGTLRNGFHTDTVVRGGHVRVTIGNNVYYAPYVEFGTSRMQGHHMLANGTAAAARWLARRGFKIDYEILK